MDGLIDFTILAFASLFVVVDPIGLIPTFLVMTQHNQVRERIRMAKIASIVAFFVLLASAVGGQWLFTVFGVTMPAFEIAGGIVLLLIALDMVQARRTAVKETREEEAEGIHKDDIAVTPLAIPLLAGPGAITTVILLASKVTSIYHLLMLFCVIFIISVITFLILRIVSVRSSILSVIAMKIITRLLGLLLTAIAVQFILNGIRFAKILY